MKYKLCCMCCLLQVGAPKGRHEGVCPCGTRWRLDSLVLRDDCVSPAGQVVPVVGLHAFFHGLGARD